MPFHKHDCETCLFLGTVWDFEFPRRRIDYWVHERKLDNGKVYVDYIRRFSSEPSDYGCVVEVLGYRDGVYKYSTLYREIMDLHTEYLKNNQPTK